MIRRSRLDGAIERFQHRWETNPQFRATMAGVLGVIFLVFMCACVGLVSVSTQSALAAMGFGGSNNNSADQGSTYTGAKAAQGIATIPIATVMLGTPQPIPDATLPPSGTPLPTPTLAPTPTTPPRPRPAPPTVAAEGVAAVVLIAT